MSASSKYFNILVVKFKKNSLLGELKFGTMIFQSAWNTST